MRTLMSQTEANLSLRLSSDCISPIGALPFQYNFKCCLYHIIPDPSYSRWINFNLHHEFDYFGIESFKVLIFLIE